MRITRNQLRQIIQEEIGNSSRGALREGTSIESLQSLHDYLIQQQVKFSGIGLMMAAYEIGDELIELITQGNMAGAAELFTSRYGAL